jgi:hypothetical protein
MRDITVTLEESDRQATLLALAHLAVERPGWKWMLSQIALKMDNRTAEGEPELFTEFYTLHSRIHEAIAEIETAARKAKP